MSNDERAHQILPTPPYHPITTLTPILNHRQKAHRSGNPPQLHPSQPKSDMNREVLGNFMTVRTKPAALVVAKSNGYRDDAGQSKVEPHVGLEFDSAEEAGVLQCLCYPTFIRVQKADSGKWVLANVKKEHNHEFEASGELCPPRIQRKSVPTPRSSCGGASRTGIRSHEDDGPSGVVDMKRLKKEEIDGIVGPIGEPYKGLEFNCANEAYKFYYTYAANTGFRIRIDPSRTVTVASKGYREEGNSVLENLDLVETNGGLSLVKRVRESNIDSDLYNLLLEYFQSRQAEDTGFFYGVEMHEGKGMNLFWADARSRFGCTQFGDAIVFDTTYRRGSYLVPFASFVGVNHHRQPVLLGCALVADESEESFTWIFQAWLRAMSGHRPVSIIADQDRAIQNAIAQVFPGTHHRFSAWQILAKEQENLGALLSMDAEFKYEYETCIFQSQTASEFDSAWNMLMNKYTLRENMWFKEMYRMRKSWVPLHIKGTFFAGIPVDGSLKSYFSTILTPQTPPNEFVVRYEKALDQRRDEERKEDFNSFNLQAVFAHKGPHRRTVSKALHNHNVQSFPEGAFGML
ncbi:UNVERIFIED_CONTAM: protein FAR1-RELATED SEQUENCE 7 [Sesamum calycinum]|uniref:Protein FAR1-RELATED SEQUENCE n=1 Tax=Sesamum calycinum TaxID=2727403 RepID=A0AAW2QJ87_9LAMI